MSNKPATLTLGKKVFEFPVKSGSIGPDVIDISTLYSETGKFTLDPSFTSTASCESKITYIDGDEGVLLYRGYPIEQLAENGDFWRPAIYYFMVSFPLKVKKTILFIVLLITQ